MFLFHRLTLVPTSPWTTLQRTTIMAASETAARKELTQHFGAAVGEHPDVMTECQ